MSEWRVTIKALISIDDPDTLDKLILCRMKTDESGKEIAQREWFGIPKSFKPDGTEHKKASNETRLRLLTTWRRGK